MISTCQHGGALSYCFFLRDSITLVKSRPTPGIVIIQGEPEVIQRVRKTKDFYMYITLLLLGHRNQQNLLHKSRKALKTNYLKNLSQY